MTNEFTGIGDIAFDVAGAVGIDEAGRGPLAGPVVAGAVVLDAGAPIEGLADSKVLDAARREELAVTIKARAVAYGIGRVDVSEIDDINILQATLLAMHRAVQALGMMPTVAYVDGNVAPQLPCPAVPVVGGDAKVPAISAASIIAKTCRDQEMIEWGARYPRYGFERHKGYGTPEHLAALERYGPTPLHRRTFAPVARLLEEHPDTLS